jgi:hypothetical protein
MNQTLKIYIFILTRNLKLNQNFNYSAITFCSLVSSAVVSDFTLKNRSNPELILSLKNNIENKIMLENIKITLKNLK